MHTACVLKLGKNKRTDGRGVDVLAIYQSILPRTKGCFVHEAAIDLCIAAYRKVAREIDDVDDEFLGEESCSICTYKAEVSCGTSLPPLRDCKSSTHEHCRR